MEEFKLAGHFARGLKEYLNNIGSALGDNGAFAQARGFFLRSLALDPDYDLSLHNLSKTAMALEDYGQAEWTLERLLERKPGDPRVLRDLAFVYEQEKKYLFAYATYWKLARSNPRDPSLFATLGRLAWFHLRLKDSAKALFRQSITLNPNQPKLAKLLEKEEELKDLVALITQRRETATKAPDRPSGPSGPTTAFEKALVPHLELPEAPVPTPFRPR